MTANVDSTSPPFIVHTESSRSWGGQEMRVLTELREMRRRGCRVALVTRDKAEITERAQEEAIDVHEVQSFSMFNPLVWWRVWRLIRQLKPDVLNAHSARDSWVAASLARLAGVPLVLRTRHIAAPISSALSFRFPHEILACSAAIAQQLISQKVSQDKIAVVPTGNDPKRYCYSAEKRQLARRKYHVSDDEVLLGNVGFLRDYKGQNFILEVLAELPPTYKVMLVGKGDEWDNLHAQARQLGIEERVIFCGHQEKTEDFYSAFDLFFFSSYAAEGVAQALVQALLSGLPILACRLPSTEEVLAHLDDCLLVGYGDVAEALQLVKSLTIKPGRDPEKMAKRHQLVAARYGLPVMMQLLEQVYAQFGVTLPSTKGNNS